MALWVVRAGKYGEREELALRQGLAVIGWEEVPDLTQFPSRDELATRLQSIYPDGKPNVILIWAGQLWSFAQRIRGNDLIALPLKKSSAIAVGRVTGPYQYRPDLPADAWHTRPVEWKEPVPQTPVDARAGGVGMPKLSEGSTVQTFLSSTPRMLAGGSWRHRTRWRA